MSTPAHTSEALAELFEDDDLDVPDIAGDPLLLETQHDSLGFAVVVTRLEETLDKESFSWMTGLICPPKSGELVADCAQFTPTAENASDAT